MSNSGLPLYNGNKTQCDTCDKRFNLGDVVFVDMDQKLIFCHSGAAGGCVCIMHFSFLRGKGVAALAMQYGSDQPLKSPEEEVEALIKSLRPESQ